MTRGAPTKSSRGATATGATATGASTTGAGSLAAMAMGAAALGAMAVGALAIGRLTVGRARLRRVEIGELMVGRLEVGGVGIAGRPAALCRVRAVPGRGDELERLVQAEIAGYEPGSLPFRAHRSATDPDRFLFYDTLAGDVASGRLLRFAAIVRRAAEQGLVAASGDDPVEVELFRTI